MDFGGFDWDAGNCDKCRKHGVSLEEIESLFYGNPIVGPDPVHSKAEMRFRAIGYTAKRRPLFVIFTWRTIGLARLVRPISARYMHRKEVEAYEEEVS